MLSSQLGLTDDQYRAVLWAQGRVDSAKDLDAHGRRTVIAHLQAHLDQRERRSAYPGKPKNFGELPAMITKIEAQLADMQLPWSYADAIARRQCGIARVAWVRKESDLRAIIAALDVEQKKRALSFDIDVCLQELGWGDEQLQPLTGKLPRNWRRQVEPLTAVHAHLQALLKKAGEAS